MRAGLPVYGLITAFALVAMPAGAQERVWTESTSLLESLVYLPAPAAGEHPTLVVALHGFGADAADMGRMSPAFTGAGFVYAALQAPFSFATDGRVARDWMLSHRRDRELAERAAMLSIAAVEAAVDDLSARYQVGEVFLLGFSQGGRMAYRMLATGRAGRFDGLVALGAGFDGEAMTGTPITDAGPRVYIGHGTADSIPLAEATAARDFLRERGYAVTFASFIGGHEVPPNVARDVIEWMRSGPDR